MMLHWMMLHDALVSIYVVYTCLPCVTSYSITQHHHESLGVKDVTYHHSGIYIYIRTIIVDTTLR